MKFTVLGLMPPSGPGEHRVVVPWTFPWEAGMVLANSQGDRFDLLGWGGMFLGPRGSLVRLRSHSSNGSVQKGDVLRVVAFPEPLPDEESTAQADLVEAPRGADVLLTGASGYLGLHTLIALRRAGFGVTALVRDASRLGPLASDDGVRVIVGDLEDRETVALAVAGQHACVHAALVWGEPGTEFDFPDTAATEALVSACGEAGVRRIVYVSSTAVHRPFAPEMRECDRLHPADIYAATKAAGEAACGLSCAESGMQLTTIRPGPIVGPPAFVDGAFRSDRRLEEIVAGVRRGQVTLPDAPARQFVAVTDVAAVLAYFARLDSPVGTYLCVSEEHSRWGDIAREAGELAGVGAQLDPVGDQRDAPRFSTRKLRRLGFQFDATDAMTEHLRILLRRAH